MFCLYNNCFFVLNAHLCYDFGNVAGFGRIIKLLHKFFGCIYLRIISLKKFQIIVIYQLVLVKQKFNADVGICKRINIIRCVIQEKSRLKARFFPNDPDYGNRNFSRASDFNVEKADYLCLRDVSLYYDFPERWVKNMWIKKLTVGVTGNTLYYWTGVSGSISPETGMGTGSGDSMYSSVSTGASANSSIAPAARKILFNVKITF